MWTNKNSFTISASAFLLKGRPHGTTISKSRTFSPRTFRFVFDVKRPVHLEGSRAGRAQKARLSVVPGPSAFSHGTPSRSPRLHPGPSGRHVGPGLARAEEAEQVWQPHPSHGNRARPRRAGAGTCTPAPLLFRAGQGGDDSSSRDLAGGWGLGWQNCPLTPRPATRKGSKPLFCQNHFVFGVSISAVCL